MVLVINRKNLQTPSVERWNVVANDGSVVRAGMLSMSNATEEAERLNREGLEEFRPYTVQRVTLDIGAVTVRSLLYTITATTALVAGWAYFLSDLAHRITQFGTGL